MGFGLSLNLGLGSGQQAAAGGGGGAVITVEASSDGGSTWSTLTGGATHNASNLTTGSGVLKLRITSTEAENLTALSTTVPQVLAAPSVPVEIPADTPTVIDLSNQDPGKAVLVLTFDGSTFSQTITCYTLDGIIRGVHSTALPASSTICEAPISSADFTAAVRYATPGAATTASDDAGDWIVGYEDAEFESAGALGVSKASRMCSDDSVKPTLGRYGDGFRIASIGAGPCATITTGATVAIHDMGLRNSNTTGQCILSLDPAAGITFRVERCRVKKVGSYEAIALVSGTSTGLVANCYIEVGASANGVVQAGFGSSGNMKSVNNTILAVGAAVTGVWGDDAGRKVESQGTYVGVAATGSSWSGGAFGTHVQAGGNGSNGSSDTSAVGTTSYQSLAAGDFITDDTAATPDLAVIDRATLDDYPCPDASLISCRDVDGTPRTDWYMGAKWIAA